MSSLIFVSPIVLISATSIFVLLAGLWIQNQGFLLGASLAGLAGALLLYWSMVGQAAGTHFSGLLVFDSFSLFFSAFVVCVGWLAFVLSSKSIEVTPNRRFEFYAILLTMIVGMIFMGSANHFLMMYVGVETVSLLSYALSGFNRNKSESNEASMKYVVYGSMASAVMVYGMSLIFGVTGALEFGEIRQFMMSVSYVPSVMWLGMLMVMVGVGFKISAAPMHMWTPDVYQGAPTPVAALLSVAPKAVGFALLARFLIVCFSAGAGAPLINLSGDYSYQIIGPMNWPLLIMISSVFTMFAGNLAALGQQSVKRLLAYSSIAHAGYMLMGLTTVSGYGLAAIVFYVTIYCLMNFGAFWICSIVEATYGKDELTQFRGLGRRHPLQAICMTVFMVSLIGLPPLAGFVAKYLLFSAVIQKGLYTLALLAAINSVISLYYYMLVIKAMYLEESELEEAVDVSAFKSRSTNFFLIALALPNVLLGFVGPLIEPLLKLSQKAVELFVGG